MENNIVDYCKEKLRAINCTALLTPVEIENLARKNPNIICNELTEELATAIIKKDLLSLRVICEFGSMVNTSISNLLDKVVKKGDLMLIHHYRDKNYFTSVIKLKYICDSLIIYETPKGCIKLYQKYGGVERNNIIAIARIPETKKVARRYVLDNNHSIFLKIASRISKQN